MTPSIKAPPMKDKPTINGWTPPEHIWLHDLGGGDVTWCEDRDPDGEQIEAVEYIRADTALQHKEEAERERDELRKRLNELALFYPPTDETFSYKAVGYASGWRAGVEAMQKKARQPWRPSTTIALVGDFLATERAGHCATNCSPRSKKL